MERTFFTIDVERRGYGRRYTSLPVDAISRTELLIDCTAGYMRPTQWDLRIGDIVRWQDGSRRVEARVTRVWVEGALLRASLENAVLLPPDFFAP
jgi:hypothetical protein